MPKTKLQPVVWAVWAVGLIAYVMAIVNRSSFSTLGTVTQQHFGIEATLLSGFLVTQIAVYTVMQIPVGVLLDRFGASRVMTIGLLLMTLGQLLMAFAPNMLLGFLARVLVGIGDAGLFISLLRLVAAWFPARVLPTVSQISALTGQMGQFISVVPLALLVTGTGWEAGFVTLTLVTALVCAGAFFILRDSLGEQTFFGQLLRRPQAGAGAAAQNSSTAAGWDSPIGMIAPPTTAIPVVGPNSTGVWKALLLLWRRPGVRLGFWVHFGSASAMHCFLLLWGSPFLMGGEGLSRDATAGVLAFTIAASMLGGIVFGPIQARFKRQRIIILVVYVVLLMLSWAAVLLWPAGSAALPLLYVTGAVIGIGGPICMIGFDVARTHVHTNQWGLVTGLVNTGSFIAALLMVFGIGMLLDLQGAGTPDTYSLQAFRVAMCAQFAVWVLTLVMVAVEFPKARRALLKRKESFNSTQF